MNANKLRSDTTKSGKPKEVKGLIQRPPNGRRANRLMQRIHHPMAGQTVRIGGVDYYTDKNGTMRRVVIIKPAQVTAAEVVKK